MTPRIAATVTLAFLSAISFAALAPKKAPEQFVGKVTKVSDADTIHVELSDVTHTVRLWGVDAPEKEFKGRWPSQPYSSEARQWMIRNVQGVNVRVEVINTDRYGRKVGKVYLGDKFINRELLRSGGAWWYQAYAKGATELQQDELSARSAKRGLWDSDKQVPPWEWRRNGGK